MTIDDALQKLLSSYVGSGYIVVSYISMTSLTFYNYQLILFITLVLIFPSPYRMILVHQTVSAIHSSYLFNEAISVCVYLHKI